MYLILDRAGLRQKYQEKIPWGNCIVAASGLNNNARVVISEDPRFDEIKEIKAKCLVRRKALQNQLEDYKLSIKGIQGNLTIPRRVEKV